MGETGAGHESGAVFDRHGVLVPGANESCLESCSVLSRLVDAGLYGDIKKGRKTENIVAPENRLELGQSRSGKIGALIDWTVVNAANLDGQSVRLRCDQQVCTEA